jgi:hypothetical protein
VVILDFFAVTRDLNLPFHPLLDFVPPPRSACLCYSADPCLLHFIISELTHCLQFARHFVPSALFVRLVLFLFIYFPARLPACPPDRPPVPTNTAAQFLSCCHSSAQSAFRYHHTCSVRTQQLVASVTRSISSYFEAPSQKREKRQFASPCLSVCDST